MLANKLLKNPEEMIKILNETAIDLQKKLYAELRPNNLSITIKKLNIRLIDGIAVMTRVRKI